jgi:cell division protein FtsI/penicillin-binding protein 2
MNRLTDHAPADFANINATALSDLGVSMAEYIPGAVSENGDTASAPVTEHFKIDGVGPLTLHTVLHLKDRSGHWLVEWSPETIEPAMTNGSSLSLMRTWAPRAPILGAGGAPLTTQAPMVVVGIEGSYVTNPVSLGAALVAAGASSQGVSAAVTAARMHPTYFEPVLILTKARYLQLKPTLYPIPGTVFQATLERSAITPGLEAHVVGSVGPITAQELRALRAPYDASSIVGQTGLEQIYESQLAGKPGVKVNVVGPHGALIATVATVAPRPGRALETSIDPTIQKAAEAALAVEPHSAALVAVRASTGQVLASVSDPSSNGFDQALDGTYPPGSTFKTVTSTALIERGLSPTSAASCPSSIDVGGAVFHNAEGDTPVRDLAQAFAESCNTAFIGLATSNLSLSSLPTAAAAYNIGNRPAMGLPAFGGAVPTPTDKAELAATAIGQARVLVSPLDMAMLAASIDTGTVRKARLVVGAPDDNAATHSLGKGLVENLHEMMAGVVASGTAANQGLPAGTYAKTGTAQYGTGNPLPTDAWLIGFNGDIAFAALVVDGGNGGPTCGPIVAKFLDSVAHTTG